MILREICFKNFRQFRNEQSIRFAYRNQKNVTVIFGQNGRGKTAVFRAIMFCLYGDRTLTQDGETSEREIHLVNTAALEESKDLGEPVETYVRLHFEHKGTVYSIKRVLLGMLDGSKVIEEFGEVTLYVTDGSGNTKTLSDPRDIEEIVNNVLDRRVREYFLFDGEKIERLTRATRDQKREISKGIRNLLNIDSLQKSIDAMKKVRKKLDTELADNSSGDLARVIKQINDNIDKRDTLGKALEKLGEEYALASSEKADVDKKLDQFGEIAGLIKRRKELESEEKERENALHENNINMRTRVGKATFLLIEGLINNVYEDIEQRKKRGEIPAEIRSELIERILLEQECICGRAIRPDSDAFGKIIEWKNKTADIALQDIVLEVWRHLSTVRSRKEDTAESVEAAIQKYGVDKNALEEARRKIGTISEKIGADPRRDTAELEEHRKNIEHDLIQIEAKRQLTESEIIRLTEDHQDLLKQRKIFEKQEGLVSELNSRADLATRCHDALTKIYKEFTEDVKVRLAKTATEILSLLLSEHGHKNLRGVEISSDYSLQVVDKWGKPFLANISAGERQIMSIAFITALAKAASGGDKLEMPWFMDTPFGRLSSDHRRNLIEVIPKETTQWVLLATDTEFRKQEAALLKNQGRWGHFYTLETNEDGSTKIVERKLHECMQILTDEVEGY